VLPCLAGEDLLDAVVWDLAALDKFRRYFLPKDTAGPPGYEVDEDVVLGEIRRLARHEPLMRPSATGVRLRSVGVIVAGWIVGRR
jgi:hypothetical protein